MKKMLQKSGDTAMTERELLEKILQTVESHSDDIKDIKTVSYTHLDVYKRQGRARCSASSAPAKSTVIFSAPFPTISYGLIIIQPRGKIHAPAVM